MARKSRKETAAVAVQEADAACRAAIYVRLSVEDTHTHSVSIETQQMIIARYLEQYPEQKGQVKVDFLLGTLAR